jgi:hypothetical protein
VIPRWLGSAILVVVMLVCGLSTYVYLGTRQSKVAAPVKKPTVSAPRPQAFVLPGTLYLVQSGAIYSLSAGRFHQLTPEAGWSQPSLFPNGTYMLAVQNGGYWSDVHVLSLLGVDQGALTNNRSRYGIADPSLDHWSFYPRLSADGGTLWMTYDGLKCDGCYDVSLAVWSMPYGGSIRQARAWTDGGYYTGGDVQPIPMPQGGVIYTKYSYNPDDNKLVGQLWFTNRAGTYGRALTTPGEDCRTPSLSPAGNELAMVCTYEKQVSYLTLATWDGSNLGPRRTIVANQLVAEPTWAPDGSGIAYFAPAVPDGPFQLWWLPRAAYVPPPPSPSPSPTPGGPHNSPLPSPSPAPPPPPVPPVQVTSDNGFDATSPMTWRS